MKENLQLYPEIVFLDGTYKLLKNKYVLMIFLVESCDGRGEIASMALLGHEDASTMIWMAEQFKNVDKKSTNCIQSFMTDKDMGERSVLKKTFPNAKLFLCRFHTLKTFKKNILSFNIKKSEKDLCLTLLEKLVYSKSASDYEQIYEELKRVSPKIVIDYFDKNWHPIHNEWTNFSMADKTFGNFTNNRIENINGKIKNIVQKGCSFVNFFDELLTWLNNHKTISSVKSAKQVLKTPICKFEFENDASKYVSYLTEYAWLKVEEQWNQVNECTVLEFDKKYKKAYIFLGKEKNVVTPLTCNCDFAKSMSLPCQHIFCVRDQFNLPRFDEDLINNRWKKSNVINKKSSGRKSLFKEGELKITSVATKKISCFGDRLRIMKKCTDDLAQIGSAATGSKYEKRLTVLNHILATWNRGEEVNLHQNCNSIEIGNSPADPLEIPLNKINLKEPQKIAGRPRGYFDTTVNYKR